MRRLREPAARAAAASARSRRWMVTVAAVHLLLVLAALAHPAGDDVPRYWAIASTHLRPYVDFSAEYPLVAVGLFRAIGAVVHSMDGFGRVLIVLNALADLAIWALIARTWGRAAGMRYGVLMAPLLALVMTKIDLLTLLAGVMALVVARQRRWPLVGAAVAVGIGIKLWPILIGVAVVAACRGRDRLRAAAWILAGIAAFLGASILAGGVDGLVQVVTFRGAHHPQVESTVGSIGRLFAPGTAIEEAGSWRVAALPGWLDPVFSALSLGTAALLAAWVGRRRGAAVGWLSASAALLLLAPVFSAQYLAWIVPALAIAAPQLRDRGLLAIVALAVGLTWLSTYVLYGSLIAGSVPADLVVLTRDLLLAGVALAAAGGRRAPAARPARLAAALR